MVEVTLSALAPGAQINLRADAKAAKAVAKLLGAPLPQEACGTSTAKTGWKALWLGPDEWLLVGPEEGLADQLAVLGKALAKHHASLVDVSHNRVILALSGDQARTVLAKGCTIDLHPRAFGPGRAVQTLMARVPVILEQIDEAPTYHLYVRNSFAEFLADWLNDAMAEFEPTPA